MSKKLVAYFSASGNTKSVAELMAKEIGADTFEIVPEQKYTKEDLDWMNKKSRSSVEMNDKKFRPAMIKSDVDMGQYDAIILGA